MNIGQQFIEALESMRSNKLRTSLTMLGVIIGVAAVVAMMAIGNGAQNSINETINSMGSNLIFVMSGARDINNPKPLTLADANVIANPLQAPSVSRVSAIIQGRVTAAFGRETSDTTAMAVTANYSEISKTELSEGSLITSQHVSTRSAVALIGTDTAKNLFGRSNNVVGQTIRVNGQPFKVIGVLASKGGSSMGSADDQILVPITTGQTRLFSRRRNQVDMIYVEAKTAESVSSASSEITRILQSRHRSKPGKDDFTLMKQEDILSSASSITGVLTLFLGGVAGIALLVGGIGIMNIMLVSVTERTREIGLRKALGARRKDILAQFLVESSLISLIGGGIGILLAQGISTIIGQISAASGTPLIPTISMSSVLLATMFSAAVGLFFGIYPANRAARLEPVEALRSE